MKTWTTFILLTILVLTACTSPGGAIPTPTIIRLGQSELETTATIVAANPTATDTVMAQLSPTSTATPAATRTVTAEATDSIVRVAVTTTALSLRAGPGLEYENIGGAGATASAAVTPAVESSVDSTPTVTTVASPSSKTGSGWLVFATGSGGDLYVVNADGTGLRKLASGVIDPVVSPDGQQVAFTRWDGAKMGALYVLDLDRGSERVVTGDIPRPKSPTWSQDGQEIIISFQHGGLIDPQEECREFDFDDGVDIPDDVAEITSFKITSENISVCYIRQEDLQWALRRVEVATGHFEDLPADLYSFNPTWDPQDSSRVIYDGLRGLMQLDIATGDLQPFTDDGRDTAPVFSPDGQKLALTYKQHDHWEVYTYDLATGSRQRLTKPPLLANPQYNSAAPTWSPDGSQIAFVTDRNGSWEIWVMNADGSNQHPLFDRTVQAQLGLIYNGVNERLLNWVGSANMPATVPSSQPVSRVTAKTGAVKAASLTGAWDFTFGTMTLSQREAKVEGTYQWYSGADTGQVTGIVVDELDQFQGVWISDGSPNSQGLLHWQLAGDYNSFSGASKGSTQSEQWCGVRSGQPLPAGCGFSGVWQLRFGSPPGLTGQATLLQTGQTVQGTYVDNQGHTGEILDGVVTVESITEAKLTGTWRNDQGEQNSFEWRLDLTTGRTYQGRRNPGNSEWCGWRDGTNEPEQCGWQD